MPFFINCTCGGVDDDVRVEALHADDITGEEQKRSYQSPNPIDIEFPGHSPKDVIVQPVKPGFWRGYRAPPLRGDTIDCPSIHTSRGLGWWHSAHGIGTVDRNRGSGIRIGVVDESLPADASLTHVRRLGRIDISGQFLPDTVSNTTHGITVCSLLAARPLPGAGFEGVAPGAEVYFVSARSDQSGQRLSQQYVGLAIERLAALDCHLIVVSAGNAERRNEILRNRILDAMSQGTICFFAAGNSGQQAGYPARERNVVGVTAFGKAEWAPTGTLAHHHEVNAEHFTRDRAYFAYPHNSTSAGNGCIAAGVGIFDTRDHQAHTDVSGTSCATAVAAGVLAVLLSGDISFLQAKGGARARYAQNRLINLCRDVGLPSEIQGLGCPILNNV